MERIILRTRIKATPIMHDKAGSDSVWDEIDPVVIRGSTRSEGRRRGGILPNISGQYLLDDGVTPPFGGY